MDIRLSSIEDRLSNIECNTGYDQIDSSYIKSEVEDIKLLLDKLVKDR